MTGRREGGQAERVAQREPLIGQHHERQPQPRHDLGLIVRVLAGQAVHPGGAGLLEVGRK